MSNHDSRACASSTRHAMVKGDREYRLFLLYNCVSLELRNTIVTHHATFRIGVVYDSLLAKRIEF